MPNRLLYDYAQDDSLTLQLDGITEPFIAVQFEQERFFLVDCTLGDSILSIKLKLRDSVGLPVARLGLRPIREGEPWYKNEATLRQSGISLQQVILCFPIEPSGCGWKSFGDSY
jgi:hypothetical protein